MIGGYCEVISPSTIFQTTLTADSIPHGGLPISNSMMVHPMLQISLFVVGVLSFVITSGDTKKKDEMNLNDEILQNGDP